MTWNRTLLAALSLLATAALAPQATAQGCIEPSEGLLAWWPGDGNATDVMSGLDGTPVNGAGFAAGFVGDAFSFDGVAGGQDDRVVLPRHALDGLADMTVEFWLNTMDADHGGLFSAANGHPGGDNDVLILHTETGLLLIVKQTGLATIPVMLNDGAWHHVAFVREGDMGHLYVDGMPVDSRAYPVGPLDVGPRGFMLGQEQDCLGGCLDPAQALDGLIDEMSVYARALAPSEVLGVFDAGSAGKCKPPEMPSADGLVDRVADLEWEVDELTAQLADLEAHMVDVDAAMTNLESSMETGGSDTSNDNGHHRRHKRWRKRWDRDDD